MDDLEISSKWLIEFDNKLLKQDMHILLLTDNCTAHEINIQLKNINTMQFSTKFHIKNSTSSYGHNNMHQREIQNAENPKTFVE